MVEVKADKGKLVERRGRKTTDLTRPRRPDANGLAHKS